jgi:hypothetical protein
MSESNRSMESLHMGGGGGDDDSSLSCSSSSSGDESDGGSVSSGSSTRSVAGRIARVPPPHPRGSAAVEPSSEKEKGRARIFLRILLKYLERKDPGLHARVRAVVARCKDKNRARVPGYESVTASTKARLRRIVAEPYWTRAEAYTRSFVASRNDDQLLEDAAGGGGRSSAGRSSPTPPTTSSQGQQTHEH